VCIQRALGPNENYAKVGHRGLGSCDLLLNSATPTSQEWLEIVMRIHVVHSMQPLPNYFGLLL